MIRWILIGRVLGLFLAAFGASMGVPAAYSLATDGQDLGALAGSACLTSGVGVALWLACRGVRRELTQREGILLTVAVWLAASLFGSLPFVLAPGITSVTDAVFEATSGVTTTGASILADVESLSRPVLLWRALSSWLGGMGIVVLVIAVAAIGRPRRHAPVSGRVFGGSVGKTDTPRGRDRHFAVGNLCRPDRHAGNLAGHCGNRSLRSGRACLRNARNRRLFDPDGEHSGI